MNNQVIEREIKVKLVSDYLKLAPKTVNQISKYFGYRTQVTRRYLNTLKENNCLINSELFSRNIIYKFIKDYEMKIVEIKPPSKYARGEKLFDGREITRTKTGYIVRGTPKYTPVKYKSAKTWVSGSNPYL